jgi:hypothetical protein
MKLHSTIANHSSLVFFYRRVTLVMSVKIKPIEKGHTRGIYIFEVSFVTDSVNSKKFLK